MSPYPTEIPERTRRGRFVTLCQQLLALAVVVAVLTPAARTVTMEVRPAQPVEAPGQLTLRSAEVPTEAVDAEVEEYALTAPEAASRVSGRATVQATEKERPNGASTVTSEVLPVDGFGTVGVSWAHGEEVGHDDIQVAVRTESEGAWSDWSAAEYHDEHGPDPASAEAAHARPGTDALIVGDVDNVQVKVTTPDAAPDDMRLAVIAPGQADDTAAQAPSIDTATLGTTPAAAAPADDTAADAADDAADDTAPADAPAPSDEASDEPSAEPSDDASGAISLQAAATPVKPQIFSRAQWGANESIRSKSSLHYYEVHAGFVHHTVNANNYTPEQVPGIIRSIYSYHVKTRGWSDIGYNFLVDRFGRIWEGRYGGVDRAVVGAHTSGYNNYSFAMAAIGNFETAQPSREVVNAYGALFAWKLAIHGVNAASTAQRLGSRTFRAINGHRDAGSTACPGKYLYAQIPAIRSLAAAAQRGWSFTPVGNYVGGANPDVLLRKATSGRIQIQEVTPSGSGWRLTGRVKTNVFAPWATSVHRIGDWNKDGYADILAIRASDRAALLFAGTANPATYRPAVDLRTRFWGHKLISAVGDITGDGLPDLMGQPAGGAMTIYPGANTEGFGRGFRAYSAVKGSKHAGVGPWNRGDSAPDSIVRSGSSLVLYLGNGPGGWASAKVLPVSGKGYKRLVGAGPVGGTNVLLAQRKTGEIYALTRKGKKRINGPVFVAKRSKLQLMG